MQDVVLDEPYKFVPPHRGHWWPTLIRNLRLFDFWLKRNQGVTQIECRGLDRLRASLAAGHSIMLAPNHCRFADPLVMGHLARETPCLLYAMASWHLFKRDRFTAWAIRKMGGFSVYREGTDRPSINMAINVLTSAERPLVIFAEGATTRTNDRLHPLLDGVSFIARTAAKRRERHGGGRVVVHPVGIKYLFQGDLRATVDPVLSDIEHRLSWHPQTELPLLERIGKVGQALLALKEIEYFGRIQRGSTVERLRGLIDRLLRPVEKQYLGSLQEGPVFARVKALRSRILPDMVEDRVDAEERQRRWRQLAEIYLSQQLSYYLPEYVAAHPSVDRLLEMVEKYEEDLTDRSRPPKWLKAVIQIGEPIAVSPQRERGAKVDPLIAELQQAIQGMLDELALESPLYQEPESAPP